MLCTISNARLVFKWERIKKLQALTHACKRWNRKRMNDRPSDWVSEWVSKHATDWARKKQLDQIYQSWAMQNEPIHYLSERFAMFVDMEDEKEYAWTKLVTNTDAPSVFTRDVRCRSFFLLILQLELKIKRETENEMNNTKIRMSNRFLSTLNSLGVRIGLARAFARSRNWMKYKNRQ